MSIGEIPEHEIDFDITSPQDGGIMKGVLVEGSGKPPREDAFVTINWEGFRKHREGDWELFERKMNTEFIVGSASEIWAVEEAVLTMKKGEKCVLSVVSPYIFRSETEAEDTTGVDKELYETARRYYVELIDFKQVPDPSDLSIDEKLQLVINRKEKGNEMFKERMFRRSIKKYQSALGCFAIGHDEDPQVPLIRVQCHLNMAACHLHLENYSECIRHCDKIDPNNVKAFVRRGRANLRNKEWDDAKEDFLKALEFEPENEEAKKELVVAKRKISKQRERDRKIYSKMLQPVEEEESPEAKEPSETEIAKQSFTERFLSQVFIPGLSQDHLKVFYIVSFVLLVVLSLMIYFSGPGASFHFYVLLALTTGLMLSIFWFVSLLPESAKLKAE